MKSVLVIILISLKLVIGYDHCWGDYNGTIPSNALVDKDSGLILAQVPIFDPGCLGLVPAGLNSVTKTAIVECGSRAILPTNNIKVFSTDYPERYYWDWINTENELGTAKYGFVKGGFQDSIGDIYFGKAFYNGSWQIGKIVFKNNPYCHFIDSGSKVAFKVKDCFVLKHINA